MRSLDKCAAWARSQISDAKYFFFRKSGNWHCSPCPLNYDGTTTRTGVDNSYLMDTYEYKDYNVSYKWAPYYSRTAYNRYCTGYKKSAFNHRTVNACGAWVKSVDVDARHFFFREEGNYHCSPCPDSYTGHATTGTGY